MASWQGRVAGGYTLSQFQLDWEKQQAVCPKGKVSQKWTVRLAQGKPEYVEVQFSKQACHQCEVREQGTRRSSSGRMLRIRPQSEHLLLEQIRQKQAQPEYKALLDLRAGIEGTLSQGVRVFGLRRCR